MQNQLIKFLVGIVFVVCSSLSVCAQDPEMVRHFDYDKNAPLYLKIIKVYKRGDVKVFDSKSGRGSSTRLSRSTRISIRGSMFRTPRLRLCFFSMRYMRTT